jgi:hypothetical protein
MVFPKSLENDTRVALRLANVRLKRLRRELYLIEKAITALTEISRARTSRNRRALAK